MDLLELVKRAQCGDNAAFSEICGRFTGLVRKYAKQAHVKAICEEAEAEAWLAVVQAVTMYDDKSEVPVAGLIESRVKYAVWNLFKREKKRWQQEVFLNGGGDEGEVDFLLALADDIDIAGYVENRLLGQEAQAALEHLSPKQRLVVLRTVLQGFSLTETAQEIGSTVQAVNNLQKRGLARLRMLCSRMYRSEGGEKHGNSENAANQQALN